jgi:hypothetical protein
MRWFMAARQEISDKAGRCPGEDAVDRAPESLRGSLTEVLQWSVERRREAHAAGDVRRFIGLTLAFHRGIVV